MNAHVAKNPFIVIIDDEESVCRSYVEELVWNCEFDQNIIHCFTDPREALVFLKQNSIDVGVVLLDLQMPHIDGLDMMQYILDIDKTLKIIVISAFANLPNVKKAVNSIEKIEILTKAEDKPVQDFSRIKKLIEDAFKQKRSHL